MKRVWLLVVASLLTFSAFAITPEETSGSAATIRSIRNDWESWRGKFIAVHGRVGKVERDTRGQPLLKVTVSEGGDVQSVWVASLVRRTFNAEDDLLLLGLVSRAPDVREGSNAAKIAGEPFVLIGVCVFNLTQKWGAAGDQQSYELCDEWFQGKNVRESKKALK